MSDSDDAGRRRDEDALPDAAAVPGEAPADPAYAAGAGFTGEATGATPSDPEPTAGPDPLGGDAPATDPSDGGSERRSDDTVSTAAQAGAAAAAVTASAASPTSGPSGASGYTSYDAGASTSGSGGRGGGAGSSATIQAASSDEDRVMVIVTHALNIAGPFTGLTSLAALILAYVKKDTAPQWARSHYTFAIRTVWIALIAAVALIVLGVVAIPLMLIGIGFLMLPLVGVAWVLLGIWIIVRSVVALLKAMRNEPYPNPETWMI